ncbi:beta-1,3-glucan-binding protein-like [Branchiostoma floridae x Branchiostoma japonicum]
MMLILVLLLIHGACAYTVKQPTVSLLSPQGLRITYPADSGVTLVAFHYNIGTPLHGVQAGQWNYDVRQSTNGLFVHENTRNLISPGQTLYYWVHVVRGGLGHNLLEQSWTATGSSGGDNVVTTTTTQQTTTTTAGTDTGTNTGTDTGTVEGFSGIGTYLGCFVDDANDRDFPYSTTLTYTNGYSTCSQHCASLGYRYIGLQYAIECSCGHSYGKHGAAPESDCYYGCSGGSGGKCGGDYRNTVWDIASGGTGGTTGDNLQLVFEDNFDTFDTSKWRAEITAGGGGNEEFQYYMSHPDNLYVQNGNLYLKPTLAAEHYGEEFLTSGYIDFWHGYNYIGCFNDGGDQDLTGSLLTASDMNPGKCVTHCANEGYEYFGLKGTECRCDNSYGSFGRGHGCHISCPGDSGKECGGNGVTSVYGQTYGDCTQDFPQGRACFLQGSSNAPLPPIQSARVTTADSFTFKYGKVEVWAKVPTGDWIWPAIWLLPRDNVYGGWPASGEIDIMESRGNRNLYGSWGGSIGVDDMGSTLHWGPRWPYNGYHLTTNSKHAKFGTYGSDFHKWVMTWTDTYLRVEVDDEEVLLVSPPTGFWDYGNFGLPSNENPWAGGNKMTPFDQEFYLIFNVAVGGTNSYFPDNANNQPYPKPWNNGNSREGAMRDFWNAKNQWYPTWNGDDVAMQIQSVKVWKFV